MSVHQTHNQLIAARIHGEVTNLLSAGANDLDIFTGMTDQMGDFKILLDSALPDEIGMLCARYEGFYRYAKILEEVAQGIASG